VQIHDQLSDYNFFKKELLSMVVVMLYACILKFLFGILLRRWATLTEDFGGLLKSSQANAWTLPQSDQERFHSNLFSPIILPFSAALCEMLTHS
jgi:hypothetical protein